MIVISQGEPLFYAISRTFVSQLPGYGSVIH
jgi:hypothetical protein